MLRPGVRLAAGGLRGSHDGWHAFRHSRRLPSRATLFSPRPSSTRSGPEGSASAASNRDRSSVLWKVALTFGAISALTSLLYANRPSVIKFDAPTDDTEPVSGFFGGPPKIRASTRVNPSDLQNDAAVTGIAHRNGDELMTLEAPSPAKLTQILRKNEEAVIVGGKSGVIRYDVNQIASNCPIEDDHSEAIIPIPRDAAGKSSGEWMFWGVYDGHSGWATSAKLRHSLIPHVYFKLEEAYKQARARGAEGPLDSEIDDAIKAGFLGLDHEIVISSLQTALETQSKQIGAQVLGAAIAGSCALLSFYDTRTQLLRVACTGDCRAVLGRRVGPKWSATQLSSDQTGANPDEIARVKAEHPDEEGVTKNGRVMGYEPSRAFGDAVLKWPRETSLTLRRRFFAKWASEKCLTPPYMTAEPVITTTKIRPENGDFVVLASDSLWEMLSNEEVVGLVGRWIDEGRLTGRVAKKQASFWDIVPWFSSGDSMTSNVQVVEIPESERPYGEGPVRPSQWGIANRPRTPVVKDVNVATHIARNGLGGDDHDMISSLFMLAGSNTRRYRDDLTITVVFFGHDG